MKANYRNSLSKKERQIIEEEANRQFNEKYNELQMKIQKDIAVQYIATVMWTLETWYGWGAKRQKQFMERVGESFNDMSGVGFIGEFNADDLKNHIKEKFGIDLDKEIQIEFK